MNHYAKGGIIENYQQISCDKVNAHSIVCGVSLNNITTVRSRGVVLAELPSHHRNLRVAPHAVQLLSRSRLASWYFYICYSSSCIQNVLHACIYLKGFQTRAYDTIIRADQSAVHAYLMIDNETIYQPLSMETTTTCAWRLDQLCHSWSCSARLLEEC